MLRTHLAIVCLAILLFVPNISDFSDKFVFVVVALAATYLPDLDSAFSTIGRRESTRIVRFFVKHRGMLHSFTFCIAVSVVFALFLPVLALPFFLGYSLHLFSDSFTLEGIKPFWPYKKSSTWKLRTGGLRETSLFIFMAVIDLVLLFFLLIGVF